jgi:hypothetical protein
VGSILIIIRVSTNIRLARNLNISSRTAMERIIREIRLADSIDGTSTFGSHPGYLKLNTIDANNNPTTMEFFLTGSNLMIQEGASSPESLTSSNVTVSNLVFYQISPSTASKAIKVEMTLTSILPNGQQKSEKFYDTVVLRRSY